MQIAIYTPYLDTAGGGEKYMLTIAEALSKEHKVDILLDFHLSSMDPEQMKRKNSRIHGLNLDNVSFVKAPMGQGSSMIQRIFFLKKYDWLFYNCDGSIFQSTSKNSVLHFQMPLSSIETQGFKNMLKLKSWKLAIYNSQFTKEHIEKKLTIKGQVVYPPVDTDRFAREYKKKKQILGVGRFMGEGTKKQHILIEGFKKLSKQLEDKDWSLHLAGLVDESDKEYFIDLQKKATGKNITFYSNLSYNDLTKLYQESSIFWHAMGYLETDPQKWEHFGISTVEAMAAGCIPVVINKGGQSEIVENGVSGLLWDTVDELVDKTCSLIKNEKEGKNIVSAARKKSKVYSKSQFVNSIMEIINEH